MPKYPLIQFELVLNGGAGEARSIVPKHGPERKTPAEIAILLRVHRADLGSPDEVIRNPIWTGDVEMDERDLRQDLRRYGGDDNGNYLVDLMFPGPLPTTCDYPDKREEYAKAYREKLMNSAGGPPPWLDVEEEAEQTATSDVGALRKEYKALFNKNASPAWDAAELRRRLAQTEAA